MPVNGATETRSPLAQTSLPLRGSKTVESTNGTCTKTIPGIVAVQVPFVLSTVLEPRNGNEVWAKGERVSVAPLTGIGLPLEGLLTGLNPVYVVDPHHEFPFN